MPDHFQTDVADRAFSDAEIVRAVLPLMRRVAPMIGSALGRAADVMIAEGDLPARGIEALHDLGHDIVSITERMGWARDRRRGG